MVVTAHNIHSKPGYKQTEVGLIPEDWKVTKLGDVADIKTGPFGSTLHEKDYVDDGTPIITVEHLSEQGIVHGNLPMVSDFDRERLKAYSLSKGDIVFSRVGSVDRNSLVQEEENGWLFSGRLLRIRIKASNVYPTFLSYYFDQEDTKQRIRAVAVGQTMASLNTQILRNVDIAFPPTKAEQQAIAAALSDVDALIASLDQLIAKKRDIKQAMMQQLLTGKARLLGFSGNGSAKLGDFFELNPSRTFLNDTDLVTFIRMEDVSENGHILNQNIVPLSAINKGLTFFERNDILVAKITPCFENGKGACLDTLATKVGYGSTEFHVLRAKRNAVPRYIFYQTQTTEFRRQLETEMIGSAGQKRVPAQAIIDYPLAVFHSKPEQQAIATILSDMDTEIGALEERREKTRALKQGMMQELLTGKTRLLS